MRPSEIEPKSQGPYRVQVQHIMLRDLLTQKCVQKFWLLILDTPEHVDSENLK
jgi:hypothetical protein